jgi:glycosyltransferase involved in cell wall biosynthesis
MDIITFTHPTESAIDSSTDNGPERILRLLPKTTVIPDNTVFGKILRTVVESSVAFLLSLFLVINRQHDLIHAHAASYATPGFIATSLLSMTPIIYDCRDTMFSPSIVQFGYNPRYFSCSPEVDAILGNIGISDERITRVPIVNPPYVSDIDTSSTDGEYFDIIYVGRLIDQKNINTVIEGVRSVMDSHDDVRFVLVGDDPDAKVPELLDSQSLPECETPVGKRIRWTGEIDHREALHRIAKADVLVNASTNETGPRTVLEAMEVETPVITTAVGMAAEVISDGESGVIITRDTDDLIAAIESLYHDISYRQQLATAAADTIAEYDWKTVKSNIEETYRQII